MHAVTGRAVGDSARTVPLPVPLRDDERPKGGALPRKLMVRVLLWASSMVSTARFDRMREAGGGEAASTVPRLHLGEATCA